MQVKDVMSNNPCHLSKTATVEEVAKKMKDLDCGFLPIGDGDKLDGVVTDRDIVLRVVAEGRDPASCKAGDVITDKVLYCFENDDVESALRSMREQQVYRLVVLNNREQKRLCGIISLGDVCREGTKDREVGETAEGVCRRAA